MKVLITLLYECACNEESKEKELINEINIYKQTPNKVYIATIDHKKQLAEAEKIISKFPNIQFEIVKVSEFDVVDVTTKINALIKKEKNNQIFINVTEGRNPMFLGGVFAASLNKSLVEGAFYLRQDTHELVSIPLMDFELKGKKRKILEELNKGTTNAMDIAFKVKVDKSFVYAAIKKLISKKYCTEDWKVTESGKISLMS